MSIPVLLLAAALPLQFGGCVVVDNREPPPSPPPDTRFELVNNTEFVLDANFFVSAASTNETGLFIAENIYNAYSSNPLRTIAAHGSAIFSLPCDQAVSIGVRRPVFSNPVTFTGGESQDQIILLRGRDFSCGDGLRFIYTADGTGFRVGAQPF